MRLWQASLTNIVAIHFRRQYRMPIESSLLSGIKQLHIVVICFNFYVLLNEVTALVSHAYESVVCSVV